MADLIGAEEPHGAVFKGRLPVGRRFWEMPPEEQAGNLITTRILRLRGLEPGLNSGQGVDSYQRYIYIHGTNHEDRIGSPSSGGCVLMTNNDVRDLFEMVDPGTFVLIAQ